MVVKVRACMDLQRLTRTRTVGSLALTKFLPKKCGGIQRVACGVYSDEISALVQVILKGGFTFGIQDFTETQLIRYMRRKVTWVTHRLLWY